MDKQFFEVIQNPSLLALVGTLIVSTLAFIQWRTKRKDNLGNTEEEIEEQKERHLIWYTENYHRLRSMCGQKHGWELVDEFEMFPPDREKNHHG